MLTDAQYEDIKARVEQGIMPSDEEMAALLEYSTAQAAASLAAQGIEVECPHCTAKFTAPSDMKCPYCGLEVYMPAQ